MSLLNVLLFLMYDDRERVSLREVEVGVGIDDVWGRTEAAGVLRVYEVPLSIQLLLNIVTLIPVLGSTIFVVALLM